MSPTHFCAPMAIVTLSFVIADCWVEHSAYSSAEPNGKDRGEGRNQTDIEHQISLPAATSSIDSSESSEKKAVLSLGRQELEKTN
eukprot:1139044-Pelagomonas_calceolata.AAC.7